MQVVCINLYLLKSAFKDKTGEKTTEYPTYSSKIIKACYYFSLIAQDSLSQVQKVLFDEGVGMIGW